MEEAATPFPSEETTPPVTKIYFGAIHAARVRDFPARRAYQPSQRMTYEQLSSESAWVSNRRIDLGNLENRKRELEKGERREGDPKNWWSSETYLGRGGLGDPGRGVSLRPRRRQSCSIEQNVSYAETVCIDVLIKAVEHQRRPATQRRVTLS